jgi:PAS domain S-box-containing protein
MDEAVDHDRGRRAAAQLALLAVAGLVAYLFTPDDTRTRAIVSQVMVAVASLAAAGAIGRLGKLRDWPSARPLAWLLALVGFGQLVLMGINLSGDYAPRSSDVVFLVFLIPLALALRDELRAHFDPRERREIAIDVGLITASLAAIGYAFLRPTGAGAAASTTAAVFAILAAAQFTAFAALTLWVPTRGHLLQYAVFAVYAAATVYLGWLWAGGRLDGTSIGVDLAFLLCPLALAAVVLLVRHEHHVPTSIEGAPPRMARPVLTSVAVVAACAALAVIAIFDQSRNLQGAQATAIIGLLGTGIAARILANQLASTEAHADVRLALSHQESALREADLALDRVREANETLRRSEEHLRLVFDTAVDGIVELDDEGVIVRANEAFARMVRLDRMAIEGQSWSALAASIDGADPGFASLPVTGQAQIQRTEGQPLHLESRVSQVPTVPPRRLLLVRDVTAAKVADQTIRSLFQYLQDRDEDRTRLLRRTNAAIEAERNRVARDLHDGPVQGVSAASLSLEAALLMIKAGETERGLEVLAKIRQELAEEADSLRRLMSGLRPPVLEERGLMPALRETLAKFGTVHAIQTSFSGSLARPVPDDLETLAYRVVQESLTNTGKHAGASRVWVRVESDATQLRVEVEDDGAGFESARAREFLHEGRVGLASMRERVELASGTFAVRSSPGRGTAIVATMPLDVSPVTVYA